MKTILKIISFAALAGTVTMAIGFCADSLTLERAKVGLLVCAIVWFGTAPFWMEHKVQ